MANDIATEGALPCPGCSYDLRGQADPACPECGQRFPSLEALRAASEHANRIFLRVLRWRQWIAGGILVGMWGGCLIPAAGIAGLSGQFVAAAAVLALLTMFATSSAAAVLLVQVVRWRFSRLIPLRQRRELTGSIPLLAFFTIPAVTSLTIAVSLLLTLF